MLFRSSRTGHAGQAERHAAPAREILTGSTCGDWRGPGTKLEAARRPEWACAHKAHAPARTQSTPSHASTTLLPPIHPPTQATVADLQAAFAAAKPKFYPSRQRFTLTATAPGDKRPQALSAGKKLSDYGLSEGGSLIFKDLGPQIGYSTVFFWEYFGPLVAYALVYAFPSIVYPWAVKGKGWGAAPSIPPKHPVQALALAYWTFHYAKRLVETFFVHKFSHGTMPLTNLFKNCAYYWGFAAYVSYFVNHPAYTPPPTGLAAGLLALALLCQAANARAHIILAGLRPAGGAAGGYAIPRGFPFDGLRVTCANYTAEVAGWALFALAVRSLAAGLFITAGALQMAVWAKAKHARLRRIFNGRDGAEAYPKRWIMLPPFF